MDAYISRAVIKSQKMKWKLIEVLLKHNSLLDIYYDHFRY